MSFWQNVENELEYRNMSRKELAQRAGFAVSGMSLGLSHGSCPSADVAVRIARVLGVTVEYLVDPSTGGVRKDMTPAMNHLVQSISRLGESDVELLDSLVMRFPSVRSG